MAFSASTSQAWVSGFDFRLFLVDDMHSYTNEGEAVTQPENSEKPEMLLYFWFSRVLSADRAQNAGGRSS